MNKPLLLGFLCFLVLTTNIFQYFDILQFQSQITNTIHQMFSHEKYQYPINWQKVQDHRKANRIGKILQSAQDELNPIGFIQNNLTDQINTETCQCCRRKVAQTGKLQICSSVEQKYSHYGPNVTIYLGMIKRMGFFLLFLSMIFSLYSIIVNSLGDFCSGNSNQCTGNNFLYTISIYNIIDDFDQTFVQMVLMVFVSIAIFVFNVYLRAYTTRKYEKINNENITDADYSILITLLDKTTTKNDLYKLSQSFIKDASKQDLERSHNFIIHDIIMLKSLDEPIKVLQNNYKKFKQSVKNNQYDRFVPQQLPQSQQFAKAAIIRFQSIHANQIINLKTTIFGKIKQYFFPFISAPNIKHKVNDKEISIIQAPEPTDIVWTNFGLTNKQRIIKKFIYWILAVVFLLMSAGIMYGLRQGEQAITQGGNTTVIGYTIMSVLVAFSFNIIIYNILYVSSIKQKLKTKTQQKIDLLQKVVIFQTLNLGFFTIFVPFLVKLPDIQGGVRSVSLPIITVTTMAMQTLIFPITNFLLYYFQVLNFIIPKLLIKLKIIVCTQKQANKLLAPPQINYVFVYSVMYRYLVFGCVFSIVSPVCLPLGAIGMGLFYIQQKILISKVYCIPQYGSPKINSQVIDIFDTTPLAISVINLLLFQLASNVLDTQVPSQNQAALYLNLVLSLLITLLPWNSILKKFKLIKIQAEKQSLYSNTAIKVKYQQVMPLIRNLKNIINEDVADYRRNTHKYQNPVNTKKSISLRNMINGRDNPQQLSSERLALIKNLAVQSKGHFSTQKNTPFGTQTQSRNTPQKYREGLNSDI